MKLIQKFKKSDKYTRYSVYLIILFSFIVLSLASIYHVSGDGCWHVSSAKFISNNLKIPFMEPLGREEPFWPPPLYHFLAAAVYSTFNLFNHDLANFAVKFISPVFGIFSLIVSFLLIKKLYNSKIAFYSLIFLAFIPIFIDYSVLSYVESVLVFFVLLSVYFLVEGRIVLSGIAVGLSILTKYNGLFILPVLLFILYKKYGTSKRFFACSLSVIIISFFISGPWLIRNWIVLGNPIWPFFNLLFNGYQTETYAGLTGSIKFGNLFNSNALIFLYLGIFGVPDGNYSSFAFLNIPLMKFAILIWLAATLVFILPLIAGLLGLRKIKSGVKGTFVVWIVSYTILMAVYIINASLSTSRIILPAFPAIALFWAFGFEKLVQKYKRIFKILIIVIIIGIVFSLFFKFHLSAKSWNAYEDDFKWVHDNTPKDAIFIANGQCIPYNLEKTSLYAKNGNFNKADFIWVNQNFKLDRRSIFDDNSLKIIQSQNYAVAYSNKATGTIVYKIK